MGRQVRAATTPEWHTSTVFVVVHQEH
jgi:hypothetical protein